MGDQIQLAVVVTSLATKVDGSIKITLETGEVSAEQAGKIYSWRGKEAWAFIAPELMQAVPIPDDKPDTMLGKKTPAQRTHNALYVLWKQRGMNGDFDSFYKRQMELIIEQIKSKLDKGA